MSPLSACARSRPRCGLVLSVRPFVHAIASMMFAVHGSINSSFMKIFNIKSMNVVSECLDMFNVLSVADYIVKRKCKFLTGYINS